MHLNLSYIIIMSFLPIDVCSKQAVIFTAHITYNQIGSNESVEEFIFQSKLPLILCLYKCLLAEKCSMVLHEKTYFCIMILSTYSYHQSSTNHTNATIYYKKDSDLNLGLNQTSLDSTTQRPASEHATSYGSDCSSEEEDYSLENSSEDSVESEQETTSDQGSAEYEPIEKEIDFVCTDGEECECLDETKVYSKARSECVKCKDGWKKYKNSCFLETTLLLNWTDYYSFCKSLNASLVILDSSEKFEYFRQISTKLTSITGYLRTWVGAVYNSTYQYTWLNGQPMNMSFFSSVNNKNMNNCVAYFTIPDCKLQTLVCWTRSHGICEYQL